MTKLRHPDDGTTHVSVGGGTHQADDKGIFDVPEEHVAELLSPAHGFSRVDEDADKEHDKKIDEDAAEAKTTRKRKPRQVIEPDADHENEDHK